MWQQQRCGGIRKLGAEGNNLGATAIQGHQPFGGSSAVERALQCQQPRLGTRHVPPAALWPGLGRRQLESHHQPAKILASSKSVATRHLRAWDILKTRGCWNIQETLDSDLFWAGDSRFCEGFSTILLHLRTAFSEAHLFKLSPLKIWQL